MKDITITAKALACLKSTKRFKILELLLESESGLKFTEIAEKLSIIPSTLEYNLKTLEDFNLISHYKNIYIQNAYSKLVWNVYNSLSNLNPVISYLKNHKIPINNSRLLLHFLNSEPLVLSDLISMLKLMKEWSGRSISKFRIAGSFNLELEEKVMRINDFATNILNLEIISTYQDFRKLIQYNHTDYFFSFADIENTDLYVVDKCNYYMGIGNSDKEPFGILFLPNIEDEIDYEKALLFNGKKNIMWLNKLFESLKRNAKRIHLTKEILENKALFDKYLTQLKK
ncbi:MAG: ArsR family transcriptional regulator [Promethearchaeota archaeon]|nr:MAG: ArsR family transcriptional regulator [Candidatus Lokiarchaeota archaeon]